MQRRDRQLTIDSGAIGIFAAKWAFLKGASRVIGIDHDWRLAYAKSKIPELEIINFAEDTDVPAKIMSMTDPDHPGLDCALECAAGEYPKSVLNKIEFGLGLQTDTAEIVNECIKSVKNFGSVGVTGYVFVCPSTPRIRPTDPLFKCLRRFL